MISKRKAGDQQLSARPPADVADKNVVDCPKKRRKIVEADFKQVDAAELPLLKDSRLDLADSEIYYIDQFIDPARAKVWYKELLELDTWYQPTLKMYGRSFLQSRQIIAFGDGATADSIKYSGTEVPLIKNQPRIMVEIQSYLEKELGIKFNHCMLNLYESGRVHIGSHSDNLENLCIASISLGAVRDFILQHKKRPADEPVKRYKLRLPLADGSLLIMQGDTQRLWKHEIPKQLRVKTGRISLTFRQLVDK